MPRIVFECFILFVFLTGCSKDYTTPRPENNEPDINIVRFSGYSIIGTKTKAPITSIIGLSALGNIIQIIRAPDASSAVWTGLSTIVTAGVNSSGIITPSSTQYYGANGSNAWFMAYYPAGTHTAGTVSWTITGQEDIITTESLSAGNKNAPTPPSLTFSHRLAQLSFEIIDGGGGVKSWGDITYIKVTAATQLELSLNDNILAAKSGSETADLITNGSFPQRLTGSYHSAGSLMVLPGITSLTIKTKGVNMAERIVTLALTTTAGNNHIIMLTYPK